MWVYVERKNIIVCWILNIEILQKIECPENVVDFEATNDIINESNYTQSSKKQKNLILRPRYEPWYLERWKAKDWISWLWESIYSAGEQI